MGVISNFYGNVSRILEEAQLAPLLTTIIDSGVVGPESRPNASRKRWRKPLAFNSRLMVLARR